MAEKTMKKKAAFPVRAAKTVVRFFRDTKGEMKKVVWPTRKQVLNNFLVVALFVVLWALIVAGVDILFGWILQVILSLSSGGAAA